MAYSVNQTVLAQFETILKLEAFAIGFVLVTG